jgi:hypothetical protein
MGDGGHSATNSLQNLLDFVHRLEKHNIFYTLESSREDALMVKIDVPGERWEVEFFPAGQVEVETFRSEQSGVLGGSEAQQALTRLFSVHGD